MGGKIPRSREGERSLARESILLQKTPTSRYIEGFNEIQIFRASDSKRVNGVCKVSGDYITVAFQIKGRCSKESFS